MSSIASQYEHFGVSFIFISNSFFIAINNPMYYLKLQRLYFYLSYCLIWYLKNLWPCIIRNLAGCGGIPFCDAGSFFVFIFNKLFYIMCLFRYHKGELFCHKGWQKAHWFLSWLVYFWSVVAIPSKDCVWSEENSMNWEFFNLAVVKKVTFSLIMSCSPAHVAAQLDHIYGLFEIIIYLFSQIVWLCIISTVGILISWSSLQ